MIVKFSAAHCYLHTLNKETSPCAVDRLWERFSILRKKTEGAEERFTGFKKLGHFKSRKNNDKKLPLDSISRYHPAATNYMK